MGKIAIVAEKPSVARDIARVLGCTQRGNGMIASNTYVVTWALGHLVGLCEPDEMDPALKRWDFRQLPILPDVIPLKILPRSASQYEIVKDVINDPEVDSLICATDSGREGELIFRLLYIMAGCKKPFQRLWISSMTDEAIREGFAHLKPGSEYDALYQSARCRSEADWLVGMNGSRAYTLRYHARLSVGRVQTPTLAILVKRAREIAAFDAREYREILVTFGEKGQPPTSPGAFRATWFDPATQETRIFEADRAKEIAKAVSGKTGVVLEVEKQQKRVPPPLLYDLTSLQQDTNRMLGLSAARTLEIAQALYERHKVITYPRTDSRYLPQDMAPRVSQALRTLAGTSYGALVKPVLAMPELPRSKRFFDDAKVSDHHAIVPTSTRANGLSGEEQSVYDLVVRRMIAAFYDDYQYDSTKLIVGIDEHRFIARGAVPTQLGWREVYAAMQIDDEADKQKAEKEGEGVTLPPMAVGDAKHALDVENRKKKTRPPSQHTESSLLGAMENAGKELEDETLRESMKESGLGTPATRAAIIERLLSVGYVQRKGKALIPTQKGEQLIDVVPPELRSPEITGRWEKGLARIARSEMDPQRFMESIRRYTQHLIDQVRVARRDIVFEREERGADGVVRGAGQGADGASSRVAVNAKSAKGTGARAASAGSSASAGAKADKPKADARPLCPLCGAPVLESPKAFGCSGWKAGCKFVVYKDALSSRNPDGPTIDAAMMKTLLSRGKAKRKEITVLMENGRVRMERAAK